jgi:hypothetical protein
VRCFGAAPTLVVLALVEFGIVLNGFEDDGAVFMDVELAFVGGILD